jgi:hypothetical protein
VLAGKKKPYKASALTSEVLLRQFAAYRSRVSFLLQSGIITRNAETQSGRVGGAYRP